MVDVITAIEQRREITQFKKESLPQEVLDQLVKALYLAPAGNNLPSREYVLVTDRSKLEQLSATTPYMKWLMHAGAGVAIIGNESLSKYWLQDASIAGAFLWLTATSLGLGAAWGAVYHSEDTEESRRREDYVRSLLGVPESMRVVAVIGVGYSAVHPEPKEMYPLERVLHRELFKSGEQQS